MSFHLICFYAFAAITAGSALAVITVRSPVHAALSLVLTFFSTACTWLLADAEYVRTGPDTDAALGTDTESLPTIVQHLLDTPGAAA